MGKAKRLKRLRESKKSCEEQASEKLTRKFQENIKNSLMWDEMVAMYGKKRAEEILKDCKGELRPGPAPGME